MAFFKAGSNVSKLQQIEEQLTIALNNNELSSKEAGSIVAKMVDFESLADAEQDIMASATSDITDKLNESGFTKFLVGLVDGAKDETHPSVQAGIDAAIVAALASGNPDAYTASFNQPEGARSGSTIVGTETGFDLEGFDNFQFDTFQVKSILTAGITTATSPFSQTFFRPVVLPASQSGIDLRVTIPQTYKRKYHAGSGAASNLERKSLVRAAIDHTILEDNSLEVIPVGDAARIAELAAVADIANVAVEQHGVTFNTRPLLYGRAINLIDVSSNSALVTLGAMTEQDTLDPLVSIGRQIFELEDGTSSVLVDLDVSTMAGAMLNIMAEGNAKAQSTAFDAELWINSTDLDYTGTAIGTGADVSALTWITGNWRVRVSVRMSATIDIDHNLRVDMIGAEMVAVEFGTNFGTAATTAQLTAFNGAWDLNAVGYFPQARRSNSSMRDTGTIVDTGETHKYRLTAPLGAPLTSVKPIQAMGNGVSLDALSAVSRMRNLGTAVSKLFDFERHLIATQDLPGQAAALGGILVTPVYNFATVNVDTMVRNRDSRHGQEDLRIHLVNAITMHSNQMIIDAGYLPALQMYTGSRGNFEVVITTDPLIANLLMSSGDGRTLGNNRRFRITEVDDARMEGRIYISLNRTDVTGADILSFGCHVTVPPVIHQARVTAGGNTADQTQLIPRENFHVTLPVLGRIDVTNLQDFYLQV